MWNAIKWVVSAIAAVLLLALLLSALVGAGIFAVIGGAVVFTGVVILLLAKEVKGLLDK
jgi:hypothetical protein